MTAPALNVTSISGGYGRGTVVSGVDLCVAEGEIVWLVGPNGSGKTTLLKLVSGLIPAASGSVIVADSDVTSASAVARVRAGLVHLLQVVSVFPRMTVRENVLLGGYTVTDRRDLGRRVTAMRERFPVLRDRWHERAGRLSRGQQRVVELARSLILEPKVLLLDEPSIGLDRAAARDVFAAIAELADHGVAVVLAEHNLGCGLPGRGSACVLSQGRVTSRVPVDSLVGPPADALAAGSHPLVGTVSASTEMGK